MYDSREDYTPPVGFAREPSEERRRWFGRLFTLIVVVFIVWLAWTRVFSPPEDNPRIPSISEQSELPAPE